MCKAIIIRMVAKRFPLLSFTMSASSVHRGLEVIARTNWFAFCHRRVLLFCSSLCNSDNSYKERVRYEFSKLLDQTHWLVF